MIRIRNIGQKIHARRNTDVLWDGLPVKDFRIALPPPLSTGCFEMAGERENQGTPKIRGSLVFTNLFNGFLNSNYGRSCFVRTRYTPGAHGYCSY